MTNQIPNSLSAIDVVAESQLKELQSIYATAPVGLAALDRDLRFVRVNNRLAEMNGIPAQQHIGKTVREIVPQLACETEPILRQVMETGQPILNLEIVGETPAQPGVRRVWVENYSALLSEDGSCIGVNVVVEEITARKELERRRDVNFAITQILAESLSLDEATPRILQTICERLDWGIGDLWILDPDASVLRCLKSWHDPSAELDKFASVSYELTFTPGVGLPGRAWTSFKPVWVPDVTNDNNFPRLAPAAEAGLHAGFAFPIVSRHKLLGVMEFFSREMREPDHALIAMFESIGSQIGQFMERKRAEEALRDADRRKEEFLATLGHELRNPLAPISAALQILKMSGPSDPEAALSRDVIERQVGQIARLLDDLLDVSRITQNKLELRKSQVTLASVMQSALETSRPLIDAGGRELTVALPPEPIYLEADPVRLAQVFSNLFNNAAKYTPDGGHIRLSADRQGQEVVVSVKDTGIGIVPEMLPHVFEMFSQNKRALEQSQGGLGIGLWLVKTLVDMHGGRVEARSEGPGQGSEFLVHLPLVVRNIVPDAVPPSEEDEQWPGNKYRLLVVDDREVAADILAKLLRKTGHEVHTAYSGKEAIVAAERFRPDVILLDIGMPETNGYDVCRHIRNQPWGHEMYIVALSGWGQEEDRRRSDEAGFNCHLVKPVQSAVLIKLLTSISAERGDQLQKS